MNSYRFGDFALDTSTRQLLRGGRPAHLSPKAFQLLQTLLEAAPRALSKAELQDRVWPDTFVVEANLQHLIVEIRASLGDDPRHPRYVRTVHRFGYAFQEAARRCGTARGQAGAICRLRWETGRAHATEGEHSSVAIPPPMWRSTRRRVAPSRPASGCPLMQVTLEDLEARTDRSSGAGGVAGPVTLADGDRDQHRHGLHHRPDLADASPLDRHRRCGNTAKQLIAGVQP